MKSREEIEKRLKNLASKLKKRHISNSQSKHHESCVFNYVHTPTPGPVPIESPETEMVPRKHVTLVVIQPDKPVRICTYGSEDPASWEGVICDSDKTSFSCPVFKSRLSIEEAEQEFNGLMADDAYVFENHKDLATLQWVLGVRLDKVRLSLLEKVYWTLSIGFLQLNLYVRSLFQKNRSLPTDLWDLSSMSILSRVIYNESHRSRHGHDVSPLMIETKSNPSFVPAIISGLTPKKFLTVKKLSPGDFIRSGIFKYDSDRIDEVLQPLMAAALVLSEKEKFGNIFKTPSEAFKYISGTSGTNAHPHICLIPSDWGGSEFDKFFGKKFVSEKNGNVYRKICRIIPAPVDVPVFFSRPDFVGMLTQISSDSFSIVLHNVKLGLAFVPQT